MLRWAREVWTASDREAYPDAGDCFTKFDMWEVWQAICQANSKEKKVTAGPMRGSQGFLQALGWIYEGPDEVTIDDGSSCDLSLVSAAMIRKLAIRSWEKNGKH